MDQPRLQHDAETGLHRRCTPANIYGGAKVDDYVGNIFLKLTPSQELADRPGRSATNTTSFQAAAASR